ncbi:MAG: LCP family protein [Actinomycetia bacterium]|nr:LCP family protein [Actinomycetes bacterium]
MPDRRSTAVLVALVALVASSCTQSASSTTVTPLAVPSTTVVVPTTTSSSTTTTTMPATTTTEKPLEKVSVGGDMPQDLTIAVATFLSAVQDPRNPAPGIDPALLSHLSASEVSIDDSYQSSATTLELETGGNVGIVTLDSGDVLLTADDGTGWSVVGTDFSSTQNVSPWFGASPGRVLVLGSDARPGSKPSVFRMDSIHILTSVAETGEGTILGYPRDSYVDTPYGEMRINALTTSARGPDALLKQFTDEWGIPLDGYILTAFSGFEKLIGRTIGRLLITLPMAIPTQAWWPGFSAGTQTLTPTRTLDYARTRKQVPGGDFTRSRNQGVVMLATLGMLQQGTINDAPMLIGELVKYTETNLPPSKLIQLAASALALDIAQIDNVVLPGSLGRGAGGTSVVFLDDGADAIVQDVVEDGVLNESGG